MAESPGSLREIFPTAASVWNSITDLNLFGISGMPIVPIGIPEIPNRLRSVIEFQTLAAVGKISRKLPGDSAIQRRSVPSSKRGSILHEEHAIAGPKISNRARK